MDKIKEYFFHTEKGQKPSYDSYAEYFKQEVLKSETMGENTIATNYHTTVNNLKKSYQRQILLNILSTSV